MDNLQKPASLTKEETRIWEIMRKKIIFGTDILGILLNEKLLKSDNIFTNEEILKYRLFQSWKDLAYIIGYTNIDDRLEEEQMKLIIQDQIKSWVSQYQTDDKKKEQIYQILYGISQKYDKSICSFLCGFNDVSCLTTKFMEDYLMFYNVDKIQYKNREDFQTKNGKHEKTERDYRLNLMNKIFDSISLTEENEKYGIIFYTRAHSLIKQENDLSSEITQIKDDDLRLKRLEFEEIFKYFKPFGPKKTSEQEIQKVYGILLYSEIHRMMKQFQELINRCKKELFKEKFKENIIPIISETITPDLISSKIKVDKAKEIAEIIKKNVDIDKKEMTEEKIILNVKSELAKILIYAFKEPIILNILKNVETRLKEISEDKFFFYGAFQLFEKKNNYKDAAFLINFEKMKKMGYRYIGYIFNHGTYNYQASHYIAIYIDIKENIIYYYDPHMEPIFDFYKRFIIYLFIHNGIPFGSIKIICETNREFKHQDIEGNCGTFASMGLFALASGIKFENYVKLPIHGGFIAQLNNVLFNDRFDYASYNNAKNYIEH